MKNPCYGDQDPIAALATVPGRSALAVIRTSGTAGEKNGSPDSAAASCIDLAASVFSRPVKLKNAPGNSVVHGWILDPSSKKKIDEVVLAVYRAPASHTGEDSVEIFCHGGIAAVKAIMSVLKTSGFREALPGEFTFRSFMNGKTDLTRAESVMELVSAQTGRGREQAVRRLSGVLEKEINGIKNMLVTVLAGTEIYLDYSEDEFSGAVNDETAGRLPEKELARSAVSALKHLSDLWRHERIYAEGILAVFAGRPNAGKSSLFNYLVREDRSIVTDTPGTTRDWIEALVSVEDIPLRLADTAGLRSPDSGNNEAENIGIQRSLELLKKADLILYVIDEVQGITEEDRNFISGCLHKPLLVIWNKTDLAEPPSRIEEHFSAVQAVSAKTGEGIPLLLHSIASLAEASAGVPAAAPALIFESDETAAGPGTSRQKELIDTALACAEEALALSDREETLDIIAPLFRSAVDALGEITGEVSSADVLDAMFSRFCVGK